MDLSFALPTSGSWATADNIVAIARAADERRCRGLWTFQRVLYPVGSSMPAVQESVLDPLIALGFAAAHTAHVRLGSAVVNGLFYAPVMLAKQLIALDVLSHGRLDAGIGLGWHPDEFTAAGMSRRARGHRFDEWLDCLYATMTGDEVEFAGEFYTVPLACIRPGPVQKPRPPVYVGGSSDAGYRRAGHRGDGWVGSTRQTLDEIRIASSTTREAAAQAGKPPEAVRIVVRGITLLRDVPIHDRYRQPLHGSLEQIQADVVSFAHAGVDELFFDLNYDSEHVGNPRADPAAAMDRAMAVLETCIAPRGADEACGDDVRE